MTNDITPVRRPRLWLGIGGVLTVIGIGVLWPLREATRVCILVYPGPPGCGASDPQWMPILGIALVLASFAALVTVYLLSPRPRTALIVLCAVIVAVTVLSALFAGLSNAGVFAPPTVIVD